jgi:DNA-binding protein H-NS
MKKVDLEVPLDDLWALYEQIGTVLSSRIVAEKQQLEKKRLAQLNGGKELDGSVLLEFKASEAELERPRRRYPKVFPKYQNPASPSET